MILTLFQEHQNRWKDCTDCSLHASRIKVVLARGKLPCDILFTGEAPGESENVIGRPFIGPAGKLLDDIVGQATKGLGVCVECGFVRSGSAEEMACKLAHKESEGVPEIGTPRIAYTNLIACIPRNEEDGGKLEVPSPESVEACSLRLAELVQIADPKLIVCVGSESKDWHDSKRKGNVSKLFHRKIPTFDMVHPAYLLRLNVAQRGLAIQRCIVTLASVFDDYKEMV